MQVGIPFHKIKKGSKIVFYGYGANGRKCLSQLVKSGYCDLVAIIDQNFENIKSLPVYPVESIKTLKFDIILITVLNVDIVGEIRNQLSAIGIDINKIIDLYDVDVECNVNTELFSNEEWLHKYIEKNFLKMCKWAKRPREFFVELTIYLENKTELKHNNLEKLKNVLHKMENDKEVIILLLLMYECEIFDSECMELYMRTLLKTNLEDDTLYGLIVDTTIMIFLYPDYVYDKFFYDRKILQKRLCEKYKINVKKCQKNHSCKRIAIVTERFTPGVVTDAPSQLVQNYATGIRKLGYQVEIFVLYSQADDNIDDVSILRPCGSSSNTLCVYDKKCMRQLDIQVYDHYDQNLSDRINNVVKALDDYSPDYIIDMADEMFVEAYVLNKYFQIINFPMRGLAYSSFARKYIVANRKMVQEDMKKYSTINMEDVYELDLGNIVYVSENEYKRADYKIAENTFVMITVGTRLKYEITEEMIEIVSQYLIQAENVVWILVGDKVETDNLLFKQHIANHRVIEWGYEKDIAALYRICNVYLNPDRRGGGVSIRVAMLSGLPIVMSDFPSDSIACMDKRHIVHGGYDKMMQYVDKLKNDIKYYKKVSLETKRMVSGYSIQTDVKKVLELCEQN